MKFKKHFPLLINCMQPISFDVLLEKYCKGEETTHSEVYHRVSKGLSNNEIERDKYSALFYYALENGFIPAGRILSACGTDILATLINCFVQPVGDAISTEDHHGRPGIYQALHQSAESMRRGGGVGYDFSHLRPKGSYVKGTASTASGPVSYMRIFDKSCETLESAGARRGAQMGSLRCDHPDIELFIHAKDKVGELTNFNISVAITDDFMHAVKNDLLWELIHESAPGKDQTQVYQRTDGKWVYKTLPARELWTQIMESTYDHAEPGVLFIDTVNKENNLAHIETIETTNPCVTGDTWVMTDKGVKQVRDLIDKPFVAIVDGKSYSSTGFWLSGNKPIVRVTTSTGRTVECTPDHLIHSGIDWKQACDYKEGDHIRIHAHAPHSLTIEYVESVEELQGTHDVYDCTIPDIHAFDANGFYVHNCAEQPLPSHGCCCLGSINLTQFIHHPFTQEAAFDWDKLYDIVPLAIRMLDNVLDTTYWPLEQQKEEAMNKRRIGLGITGLGDTLIMLGLKYDTSEAREWAARVTREIRDHAYLASTLLAKEKGAYPFYDKRVCDRPFIQRLPQEIQDHIKEYGLRNSHLLSIAPTGTISLAFADNASNGIEPPFSWTYTRTKRMKDGSKQEYQVEDAAYRLYRQYGYDVDHLPSHWVTALEISATDHAAMLAAVQPYVDSSISKTVNCPSDYPFEDFKNLYLWAWENGLKGLSTFRPNAITGSVLSENTPTIKHIELQFEKRPRPSQGNPSWTYMVDNRYAVIIGEIEREVFEVWVNGQDTPRGLGALAKSLSMDMRIFDRNYLLTKLHCLQRCHDKDVATLASLVLRRWKELGTLPDKESLPIHHRELKTCGKGAHQWTMDIDNIATGDQLTVVCKEGKWSDGKIRPYAVWLAGEYPKALDGLCKSLSLDMRVLDSQWILSKLSQLSDYSEARGDFMGWIPGLNKKERYPSTVAYLMELLLYRYKEHGHKIEERKKGNPCPECRHPLLKVEGCNRCTHCGYIGECG